MGRRKNEVDAIVVGGGIVGTSIAYHLAEAGADTLLIDRCDAGRATSAGAGIVTPAALFNEPVTDFAGRAVAYLGDLAEALAREGEASGYDRCGLLMVASAEDEVEELSRTMPAGRPVKPSAAARLFPALGPNHGAALFPDGARVDGRRITRALRAVAERRGLAVRDDSVVELIRDGDRVAGVRTERATVRAGAVALAAGAWSGAFAETLGIEIPIEPQRGQLVHLDFRHPDTDATAGWPIIDGFRHHYIVPWPDGRIVAGATRETGSGFAPRRTAAGVREVLDEALRVAPGLADAELAEVRVGLRPLSLDGLPILGPVPGLAGAYLATGHGPNGLALGPYSGRAIAEAILGRGDGAALAPFSITRFG